MKRKGQKLTSVPKLTSLLHGLLAVIGHRFLLFLGQKLDESNQGPDPLKASKQKRGLVVAGVAKLADLAFEAFGPK